MPTKPREEDIISDLIPGMEALQDIWENPSISEEEGVKIIYDLISQSMQTGRFRTIIDYFLIGSEPAQIDYYLCSRITTTLAQDTPYLEGFNILEVRVSMNLPLDGRRSTSVVFEGEDAINQAVRVYHDIGARLKKLENRRGESVLVGPSGEVIGVNGDYEKYLGRPVRTMSNRRGPRYEE